MRFITVEEIRNIRLRKTFYDKLTVKRISKKNDVFRVIGYYYGQEEVKFSAGSAEEIAKFLNSYFGLTKPR